MSLSVVMYCLFASTLIGCAIGARTYVSHLSRSAHALYKEYEFKPLTQVEELSLRVPSWLRLSLIYGPIGFLILVAAISLTSGFTMHVVYRMPSMDFFAFGALVVLSSSWETWTILKRITTGQNPYIKRYKDRVTEQERRTQEAF